MTIVVNHLRVWQPTFWKLGQGVVQKCVVSGICGCCNIITLLSLIRNIKQQILMLKLLRSSKLSCSSKPFITLRKQQISNCWTGKKSHGQCICIAYAHSAYDYVRLMWIAVEKQCALPVSSRNMRGYAQSSSLSAEPPRPVLLTCGDAIHRSRSYTEHAIRRNNQPKSAKLHPVFLWHIPGIDLKYPLIVALCDFLIDVGRLLAQGNAKGFLHSIEYQAQEVKLIIKQSAAAICCYRNKLINGYSVHSRNTLLLCAHQQRLAGSAVITLQCCKSTIE